MKVLLTERFQKEVRDLEKKDRAYCFELILKLAKLMGHPHQHSGSGLRKLHPSGIWEGRVGLHTRVVFTLNEDEVVLIMVGSHDHVRRFLASL